MSLSSSGVATPSQKMSGVCELIMGIWGRSGVQGQTPPQKNSPDLHKSQEQSLAKVGVDMSTPVHPVATPPLLYCVVLKWLWIYFRFLLFFAFVHSLLQLCRFGRIQMKIEVREGWMVLLIICGCLVITGHNAYCLVNLYICHTCLFVFLVLLLYYIYDALLPFCGE